MTMKEKSTKKWYIWMLFLSVFSTGVISSCQDELVSENERFMDDQSCLERVKVWYAEQKQGTYNRLRSLWYK